MQNASQKAVDYFMQGFSCAESVLKAVAEAKGIDSPLIPKIATAFGSGLSATDGTCGALSGGYLALSLLQGRNDPKEARQELYANIATLKKRFERDFQSNNCTTLLGFSLSAPDAGAQFQAGGCKEKKCTLYVKEVVETVLTLI